MEYYSTHTRIEYYSTHLSKGSEMSWTPYATDGGDAEPSARRVEIVRL